VDPTTESEPRPPSAQIPGPSNLTNEDSERPSILATEAVAAHAAVQSDIDHEPDEAGETSDSSLEDVNKRRKRKCRPGVKKPRIPWQNIQSFDRDAMNDEAIQARLSEVARVEYEKGGTGFPPGT